MVVQSASAGGSSALARVKSFEVKGSKTIVDIEWVNEKGFISENQQTKLKFDLYQWQDSSFFVKNILSKFYNPYSKKYPLEKFNMCLDILKQKQISGEPVELGQVGGASFQTDEENPHSIIIPYAENHKTSDGSSGCLLYSAQN